MGRTPWSAADALVGLLSMHEPDFVVERSGSRGTRADQGVRPSAPPLITEIAAPRSSLSALRDAIQTSLSPYGPRWLRSEPRDIRLIVETRSVIQLLALGRPIALHRGGQSSKGLKEKLMKIQRTIFASAGIAVLFAAASFAQQVKTDYDRSANFSQYKTYC